MFTQLMNVSLLGGSVSLVLLRTSPKAFDQPFYTIELCSVNRNCFGWATGKLVQLHIRVTKALDYHICMFSNSIIHL